MENREPATSQIADRIKASIAVKQALLGNQLLLENIARIAGAMVKTFQGKGKALFCGNGGSAADAQHIAAELSGRFYKDRPPLYAEALHVNTSYLTAVANDYGYEAVYARMVQAMGQPGDILFAISTSGNSSNILKAVAAAKEQQMTVVGMTGEGGGELAHQCDWLINVPSTDTPRIQESHILIGHILCEFVESMMFSV